MKQHWSVPNASSMNASHWNFAGRRFGRLDYSVIKWLSRPRQHLPRKPQIEDEESRPDQSVETHRNPKIDGVRRALDLAAAFERHVPLSHAKVRERPRDHDKDKKDYRDPNPRHFFSLSVGRTARRI